ncbi:MAG: serine--glyoxylate aminotransferase, partial [Pseudomonadota bacterium]
MSTQNPVFIPGPTNIPEELRRAIDFPSLDHRSATFVDMFTPLRAGVRRILKSKDAEVVIFPATGT